jgi:integrase
VFQPSWRPDRIDPEAEFRELWAGAATVEPAPAQSPANSDLRAQFATDQEARDLAAGTVQQREIQLRAFDHWLDGASYFTATPDQVAAFLDGRALSHKTRYSWISNLHRFYRWAINSDLTTADPTAGVARPKSQRTVPRPARSDQLAGAIDRATPRVRCWILLAAFGGLKVSEIAGLRWEDVTEGQLRVRASKRRGHQSDRFVRLYPVVLTTLLAFAQERPTSGWVFTRPLGGRYPPGYLSARFNGALRDLGVHATANQLRGWFASNLYATTHDLAFVQAMLGHATPATTANAVIPE